jgi:DNA polymerase-3 subunit gamma/tau
MSDEVSHAPAVAPPASCLPPPATPPDWTQRIETLGLDGMTRQFARHCAWLGQAEGTVRLALEARARHLLSDERRAAIQRGLSAQAGTELTVSIEVGGGPDQLSPAAAEEKRVIERQRAAEAAIEADPQVRAFKEAFGATVRPGSVQPVDGNQ